MLGKFNEVKRCCFLGASEIAAYLNENPYKTPERLLFEKEEDITIACNKAINLGIKYEPLIINYVNNHKLLKETFFPNNLTYMQECLMATPDAISHKRQQGMEVKTRVNAKYNEEDLVIKRRSVLYTHILQILQCMVIWGFLEYFLVWYYIQDQRLIIFHIIVKKEKVEELKNIFKAIIKCYRQKSLDTSSIADELYDFVIHNMEFKTVYNEVNILIKI